MAFTVYLFDFSRYGYGEQKEMSRFEKQTIEPELLSDNFEMVNTRQTQIQKHSMKDVDKVLDKVKLTPTEMARLKLIVEASK